MCDAVGSGDGPSLADERRAATMCVVDTQGQLVRELSNIRIGSTDDKRTDFTAHRYNGTAITLHINSEHLDEFDDTACTACLKAYLLLTGIVHNHRGPIPCSGLVWCC